MYKIYITFTPFNKYEISVFVHEHVDNIILTVSIKILVIILYLSVNYTIYFFILSSKSFMDYSRLIHCL